MSINSRFMLGLSIAVSTSVAYAEGPVIASDLSKINDGQVWKVTYATAQVVMIDSKQAMKLTAKGDSSQRIAGLAIVSGSEFTTGTIEVDLKGKNVRQESFLGVVFNVANDTTFEGVYFRPFNFQADPPFKKRAVQYISWPENTWEKLRETKPGQFENAVDPVPNPDGWFHARIKVGVSQVEVFVDNATTPSLTVPRLAGIDGKARPVGLFVDVADGVYANLKIRSSK